VTAENQQAIDVPKLVQEAHERTKDYLIPTPLEFSRHLSDLIEGEVWLKLDLVQRTASFKYRGAVNKILSLTEEELDRGIVSASTGNYALAVAEAMRHRGRRATIYVARDMEESRLKILRSHGLDLVIHGDLAWDAEAEARRVGQEEGKVYVSPYNDPNVVGGQGTCGYEISEQLPDVDAALFACCSKNTGWSPRVRARWELAAFCSEKNTSTVSRWLRSYAVGTSIWRYSKRSSVRPEGADLTGLGRYELDIIFAGMQYGIPNRMSA
jgi:hypothetical protein